MTDIPVNLGSRSYRIHVASGALGTVGVELAELRVGRKAVLVSDPPVTRLHGEPVAESLRAAGFEVIKVSVPEGEQAKGLETAREVWNQLLDAGCDRTATVVALGGGAVGDLAGFVAATYMRGMNFVQVPTTLLAQVDASIGGKTAIDHPRAKNLIGAFHQPHAVIVDPLVLVTLPRREFRAGLYEVIKYGMTSSASLFDRVARERKAIFTRSPEALTPIIAESCRIKASVVADDEREAGPRRVLNFGHTAGHAIEAVTKYRRFRHGEAVGYGMLVAAELAKARGALADRDRQALADVITSLGPLPPIADLSATEMLDAMKHDKKVVAGRLHFVLPTAVGATTIVDDVTAEEIRGALKRVGFAK